MIILPENALMIHQLGIQMMPKDSLLRMTWHISSVYTRLYTDGEDFDIDLNMEETRMKPPHPCQLTKEVEPFWIKHDNILTAKQADFVYKELSTSSNTTHNKENCNYPITPEETELDNVYQKTLISGIENKVEQSDQKKSPAQMKEWSILSDHVKYITFDGSETFNNINIDQLNYRQDIDLYREVAG